jgi:F5/8 type C domain
MKQVLCSLFGVFALVAAANASTYYRIPTCGQIAYGQYAPLTKTYSGTIQLNPNEHLINTNSGFAWTDYLTPCQAGPSADFMFPNASSTLADLGFYVLHTYFPPGATRGVYDPHYALADLAVNYNQSTGLITWSFTGYNGLYCDYVNSDCSTIGQTYYYILLNIQTVQAPQLLSQGKPAFGSSAESSCYTAANAVDGDMCKRWGSKFTDNEWLVVDLGNVQKLSTVKLYWENSAAAAYNLQVSSDGVTYATIGSKSGFACGARTDSFPNLTASGRFVKMQGVKRSTQYGYSLYEMQVLGYAATGTLDTKLSVPTSVSCASSTQGCYVPANAFDLYPDTRWASNWTDNEWIYVDLGSVKTVTGIYLEWENAYASSFAMQISQDAKNWTTFNTVTNTTGQNTLLLKQSAQGRYVRMLGIKRATGYGYSLYNFEVYGH